MSETYLYTYRVEKRMGRDMEEKDLLNFSYNFLFFQFVEVWQACVCGTYYNYSFEIAIEKIIPIG